MEEGLKILSVTPVTMRDPVFRVETLGELAGRNGEALFRFILYGFRFPTVDSAIPARPRLRIQVRDVRHEFLAMPGKCGHFPRTIAVDRGDLFRVDPPNCELQVMEMFPIEEVKP